MSAGFALKVVNALLLLLTSVLLSRWMGPSNFGEYAFAMSFATLAMVPVQLGIPGLLVREVARGMEMREWGRVRGAIRMGWIGVCVLSALITSTMAIVLNDLDSLGSGRRAALLAALLLIPLTGLNQIRQAVLQGFKHVVAGQIPEILVAPVAFVVAILIAKGRLNPTADTAVYLRVIATFLALLVGLVLFRANRPEAVASAPVVLAVRDWARTLAPFSLLAALGAVKDQVDVLLLGLLASPAEIGLYRVAMAVSGLIVFAQTAFNMALAPRFAALYSSSNYLGLERLARFSSRWVVISMLPIAACALFAGHWLLTAVYGMAYANAALPLAILSIGQLINGAVGSVALILNMCGGEKDALRTSVVMLLVSVALMLVLVPTAGVIGAALASTVSTALWNLLLLRQVRKRTGINPAVFSGAYRHA